MIILIPIIITILGLMYIFSPIDFIPEIIFGPIGLADDAIVAVIIGASWILYFSFPVLEIISTVILTAAVIFALSYLAIYLFKKIK